MPQNTTRVSRRSQQISLIIAWICSLSSPQTIRADGPVWAAASPLPSARDLATLDGVRFEVIKPRQPDLDGFNWLHGVALVWHRGRLYASFGLNRGAENTAGEEAHFAVSTNHGRTWTPPRLIDAGDDSDLAISHGVFLEHAGTLWAFQGAFTGRMKSVHTRGYRLNDETGDWEKLGEVVGEGFWPMQEPQRLPDGSWLMAGVRVQGGLGGGDDWAAVAIAPADDLTTWNLVPIEPSPELDLWGESTVLLNGHNIRCLSRFRDPIALVADSTDGGRTWTRMERSNLPMAASKPYAGTLSTGQHYLIAQTTADGGNRRSPLTIAVSRPHDTEFSQVFRIRDAVQDGPGESNPQTRLSYPYAVEHDGHLYVGYSNDGSRGGNRNSAELAAIPVTSLQVANDGVDTVAPDR